MKKFAVKFVDGSKSMIEGLAIPFGGPFRGKDLDGEDFSSETDFALDWFDSRPLLYEHGLNDGVKTGLVGRQVSHEMTDEGVWARAELDTAHKYHAVVSELIDRGALGFSSGAPPHLVSATKSGHITRWPWTELSLTPTPANPLAVVYAVKSSDILARFKAINTDIPAPLAAALGALDDWDRDRDEVLPDGTKFADLFDRLLADGNARVQARKDWHGKSGRVLSAATRERLAAHPESLRTLAKDLEDLLSETDTGKAVNLALVESLLLDARLNGVTIGRKAAAADVSSASFALDCVLRLIASESDDLDPADPDYAEDQNDVALLSTARDALTEYIASTAKEVGSDDDLADLEEEAAALISSNALY